MLCTPQIVWPMFELNNRNSKKRTPCSITLQVRESKLPPGHPHVALSLHSLGRLFVLARVCMRMPKNITNGLSPSEKLRFPCSILTALSSWRILRRSLPLAAAPPTTPHKRMQLAKNTQLTKLPRSDSVGEPISRSAARFH
jgi:hypothetical protein